MLAWQWNPTRQPARSPSAATVTTTMALSIEATRLLNPCGAGMTPA